MQIQSFTPGLQTARNLAPKIQADNTPPQGDKVELNNQPPTPPNPRRFDVEPGRVFKAALGGAAALAIPTAIGAAAGVPGAVVLGLGGAAAGILGGKASGFITLDFRAPAALALGGGAFALAMAGHAFGGPAVGVAALAGGAAMAGLMLRK
ncbi:hypothetical protein JST97_04415 [bacterium]|nr:hypothetical protein [bacterium]